MSITLNVRIAVTKAIKDRIAAQQVKGPKRQASVALEMLLGAAAGMDAIGNQPVRDNLLLLATMVSCRGIEALS